ncbi:baseplate J/gp47 family protein [Anaeromicropila populeti]|uniref:Uncharacterized phage protein gp47/JayE n=1 Tax=Anaeromicropila populeti TaxID=37658 RepID=A0A1I6JI96_9FIRM|nr:baseplate J/gp47 family protein [Anaeromicropila populeti]SFR78653.1 Uncharacterized phage protein gp47/JayE [Anaeromicropila populeti]
MFEEMTYEAILEDMLDRVTSDVDKREGSVIYDALAPCAYQLAQNYFNLNNFLDLVSGDTAIEKYLDRIVADYGITRKPATCAVRKINTSGPIESGTRWGIKDTSYVVTKTLSTNVYSAQCEQSGEIGNTYTGELENIDNVGGVLAVLTDIITSGENEETDENLRNRFFTYLQRPGTSGNAFHYREWALLVPGVGDAKVFPLWNGSGTVKILIVNNNLEIDKALETSVLSYIETVRPIGATVTVESPIEKNISISSSIVLDGSATYEEVVRSFTEQLGAYLKKLVFQNYSVSYAKIGSLLLSVPGVLDYSNLLINNGISNLLINEVEIPSVGTITLTEVV